MYDCMAQHIVKVGSAVLHGLLTGAIERAGLTSIFSQLRCIAHRLPTKNMTPLFTVCNMVKTNYTTSLSTLWIMYRYKVWCCYSASSIDANWFSLGAGRIFVSMLPYLWIILQKTHANRMRTFPETILTRVPADIRQSVSAMFVFGLHVLFLSFSAFHVRLHHSTNKVHGWS